MTLTPEGLAIIVSILIHAAASLFWAGRMDQSVKGLTETLKTHSAAVPTYVTRDEMFAVLGLKKSPDGTFQAHQPMETAA